METKKADSTSWCSSNDIPAAKTLECILNEIDDSKLNHHINIIISKYNLVMKNLEYIPNQEIKNRIQLDYFRTTKNSLENSKKLPEKVRTHLLCVVTAIYRNKLRK